MLEMIVMVINGGLKVDEVMVTVVLVIGHQWWLHMMVGLWWHEWW